MNLKQPKIEQSAVSGTSGSLDRTYSCFWYIRFVRQNLLGSYYGSCSHNAVSIVLFWLANNKNSGYVPANIRDELNIKQRVYGLNSNSMNASDMAKVIKDFRSSYSSSGTPALSPVGWNKWDNNTAMNE